MDFAGEPLVFVMGVVAVAGGIIALGVYFYPKLKKEEQGYPFEAQIEELLLPYAFQGICAAYRIGEVAVDEAHERLKGADKKKIADSIYAMLPDRIGGYDVTLVKRLVPRERFEELVQDAFDRFDRFFVEHKAHFDREFTEWAETGV
jgi:hypothetical protein